MTCEHVKIFGFTCANKPEDCTLQLIITFQPFKAKRNYEWASKVC